MQSYYVIYERATDGGWGAYVPDFPGLGIAAETRDEAEKLIAEGLRLHIAGLIEDGLPIPESNAKAAVIAVCTDPAESMDPLLALIGTGRHLWENGHVEHLREGWIDEKFSS